MSEKADAQAIAELVWFAEMSATCCRDLGQRNEKLRAELEAANARIAEMEAEHGPGKCAKIRPPTVRPDFHAAPEDV